MQNKDSINAVQAEILRQLFSDDDQNFAKVNAKDIPSDQFSYHLRQLVKYGLIEKSPSNKYRLSQQGKTRTIMLYDNKAGFIQQGFLAVRVVLTKFENGEKFYLMQRRDKVPYKGTYATPGDKILFGEDVAEAAKRIMKQQTGLTCDVELRGIRHLKDRYQNKLVQDKYFFVLTASNPKGRLKRSAVRGPNLWLTRKQIEDSGLSIHRGLELLDMAETPGLSFDEQTIDVESY